MTRQPGMSIALCVMLLAAGAANAMFMRMAGFSAKALRSSLNVQGRHDAIQPSARGSNSAERERPAQSEACHETA